MKTKTCIKCKTEKLLKAFYKTKHHKDGLSSSCKECLIQYKKIYHEKNKEKISKRSKEYFNKNKEKIQKQIKQYKKRFPWKIVFQNINSRCNNSNNPNFKYYGGRGIKCLITEEELKELWFRDKAYEMKKPSIDRIDNDENYCYNNCQFIEQSKNSEKRNQEHSIRVLQYDLEGNFIKEWESINEATRCLNIGIGDINRCINNKRKTSNGFIWKKHSDKN